MTGHLAAIGAEPQVQGFGLAGALVIAAGTPQQVRAAWRELPSTVTVVVLTADAAAALTGADRDAMLPLVAVLPPTGQPDEAGPV